MAKLWNREPKPKPPFNETPTQKKQSPCTSRKEARNRPFEQKNLTSGTLTTVENLEPTHE